MHEQPDVPTTPDQGSDRIPDQAPDSALYEVADTPSGRPAVERAVKDCVQELLRTGVLKAARKPNLYRTALTARDTIDGLLVALDLGMQIDEVLGLAFIQVVDAMTKATATSGAIPWYVANGSISNSPCW